MTLIHITKLWSQSDIRYYIDHKQEFSQSRKCNLFLISGCKIKFLVAKATVSVPTLSTAKNVFREQSLIVPNVNAH